MDALIEQSIKRIEQGLVPHSADTTAIPEKKLLQQQMAKFNVPGVSVAVLNKGKLEWAKGYGFLAADTEIAVTQDTLFCACSMTKLVTTMAVLVLVQEGLLDLDEDVNNKLKSWQVPESELTQDNKVTLRLLLSHQAGFIDADGSFDVYQEGDPVPTCLDILKGESKYNSTPVQVEYVPGSRFEYSDAGFCVIEQLLVDVTGNSFEQIAQSKILQPLKMTHSRFQCNTDFPATLAVVTGHDKHGNIVDGNRAVYPYLSGAALWSTPKEISLSLIDIFKLFKGAGQLNISTGLIQDMLSPQGNIDWAGLGIFLDKSGETTKMLSFGWGVGAQCMISVQPESGIGAVVMTNSEPGCHQNKALVGEIIRSIEQEYA